jgi:hypothetical protein
MWEEYKMIQNYQLGENTNPYFVLGTKKGHPEG